MPKRIQMTRKTPWRHEHPDAVIVARPTKWGNGFRVTRTGHGWIVASGTTTYCDPGTREAANELACRLYRHVLVNGMNLPDISDIRHELAGRDLACWCPLPAEGEPDHCHAAVLLEIAAGHECGAS